MKSFAQYLATGHLSPEEASRILRGMKVRNVVKMLEELGHDDLATQLAWKESNGANQD